MAVLVKEIFPDIFLILSSLPDGKARLTYFIKRAAGNILLATKADIAEAEPEIVAAGGVSLILLGDRHHAAPHSVAMAQRLGARIIVSSIEAAVLKKAGIAIAAPLPFQPCQLAPDLEIIPTPGHTKGAFSYVWTSGTRRFLFIGDTIVPVDGTWHYWVSRPSRPVLRNTLEQLGALDFDVILSNSFAATPLGWVEVRPHDRKKMFAELICSLS